MDFNNMVFPNPKKSYSIRFPLLYRIPRIKDDFSMDAGIYHKKKSLWFL